MYKKFKKLTFSLFFMFLVSIISVCALDNFHTVSQKFSLENKTISNKTVSKLIENDITKEDNTTVQEYFIPNNIPNCKYKYLKISKSISYKDNSSKKKYSKF